MKNYVCDISKKVINKKCKLANCCHLEYKQEAKLYKNGYESKIFKGLLSLLFGYYRI